MKQTCTRYTLEDISRFIDNELPRDQQAALAKHCVHCPDCTHMIELCNSISNKFTNHFDQLSLTVDPSIIEQKFEQKFEQIQTLEKSWKKSWKNLFGFSGRYSYLKLVSIIAIAMIGLYTFQGKFFDPSGPSAIVKYVDTDFASVMIIETHKERHTIIWFSET